MKSVDLTGRNTLGVPSLAERALVVRRESDLAWLADTLRCEASGAGSELTVLGGGSNVVLRRRVGGVVCLMRTRGMRLEPERAGARLTVAAGERWHDVVRFSLGQGYGGLENLALIPGAVGAAPIQNIGAYGIELADRFVSLRVFDTRTGRTHVFRGAECGFGYRDSRFKRPDAAHLVIVELTLRLARRSRVVIDYPDVRDELAKLGWTSPTPLQVAEAVVRIRRRKLPDPRVVGNVGSFFKNPQVTQGQAADAQLRLPGLSVRPGTGGRVKLSAAQLIDAGGWKGRSTGLAAVWHRQPLVLVNRGGATAADVLALSDDIRRDVAERFGVTLDLEPRVIGQD